MSTIAPTESSTSKPNFSPSVLFILAAVQFTHTLDFMVMMPLGPTLMRVFEITPTQFSHLEAVYALAAALTCLAGGFVMDRVDRKRALLWLYAGFTLSILACAFAPSYHALLATRLVAGVFCGAAESIVMAVVSDVTPPQRRGQGIAIIMMALPLASVLGVPAGLMLAEHLGWHAPFLLLFALSAPIWLLAYRLLPSLPPSPTNVSPIRQMWNIVSCSIHLRGFLVTASLVFGGGMIVPLMSPALVANTGLPEPHLKLIYLCGGIATFFTIPIIGRMSDRYNKLHIFAWISTIATIVGITLTHLNTTPLWLTLTITSLLFVAMSGRYTIAMAMISNTIEARFRGGFMSVNSAIQHAFTGLANLTAGALVSQEACGRLNGYAHVGLISAAIFALALALAWLLCLAVPHAACSKHPAPDLSALGEQRA